MKGRQSDSLTSSSCRHSSRRRSRCFYLCRVTKSLDYQLPDRVDSLHAGPINVFKVVSQVMVLWLSMADAVLSILPHMKVNSNGQDPCMGVKHWCTSGSYICRIVLATLCPRSFCIKVVVYLLCPKVAHTGLWQTGVTRGHQGSGSLWPHQHIIDVTLMAGITEICCSTLVKTHSKVKVVPKTSCISLPQTL